VSRVSVRLILVSSLVLLGGCLSRCGSDTPTSEPSAPEAVVEPVTPSDPVLAELAVLAERGVDLPPATPGVVIAEREVFRRDVLLLGNKAIEEKRMDVVLGVSDVLTAAGEVDAATAFLQRSVGLVKPAAGNKAHLLRLAEVKRINGKPLEGASLLERAVDIEPSTAADFIGLSRVYLAAGRPGPARAAVTRGLRKHAGDPGLALQGAEVKLVTGDAAAALAALPGDAPAGLAADVLRVKAEALLVSGDAAGAATAAKELSGLDAESPWGPLLGGASARSLGQDGSAQLAQAAGLAGTSRSGYDARIALTWAEALTKGDAISPWPRLTGPPPTPKPTVPAPVVESSQPAPE
jgi:hypothetical protein